MSVFFTGSKTVMQNLANIRDTWKAIKVSNLDQFVVNSLYWEAVEAVLTVYGVQLRTVTANRPNKYGSVSNPEWWAARQLVESWAKW